MGAQQSSDKSRHQMVVYNCIPYLPGLNLTVFKDFLISCLFFSSEDFTDGKAALLKLLIDAEAAGSSAAIQLASFKDAVEDEFSVSVVQFSHPST